MATIEIGRSHAHSFFEAKRRAEAFSQSMQEALGIRYRWEGDSIRFDAVSGAAKGITGIVSVHPGKIHVAVDLPFFLLAVKGSVKSKINQKLDALLE